MNSNSSFIPAGAGYSEAYRERLYHFLDVLQAYQALHLDAKLACYD